MYELPKIGKVFTSKFVGTGPLPYEKRIYRAAVSQRLRNTALEDHSTDECDICYPFVLSVMLWGLWDVDYVIQCFLLRDGCKL